MSFLGSPLNLCFSEHLLYSVLWGGVRIGGKDSRIGKRRDPFSGRELKAFQGIEIIPEKTDPVAIIHVRKVDVNRIPLYPEITAREFYFAAFVEGVDQCV